MRCKRRRADCSYSASALIKQTVARLRLSEELASVDVASEPAARNAAEIVETIGVRAIEQPRPAAELGERKAARRRMVACGLILLDRGADYRASRGAGCGADGRAANMTSGRGANDCAGRSSGS